MPSFKPKPQKKIKMNRKSSTTLDGKHNEFLNEFIRDETDNIPQLKEEMQTLEEKLKKSKRSKNIDHVMETQDKISEIKQSIKDLKNKKKSYYLDNSKYIFDYFENKKNISEIQQEQQQNTKNKLLDNFFKIKSPENEDKSTDIKSQTNILN